MQNEPAAVNEVVDAHIHLFPPDVRENRQRYLDRDSFFGRLYSGPKAAMVPAEQALADMDRDQVAVAVVAGWPWQSQAACVEHNTWAMTLVRRYPDRFAALAVVQPAAGAEAAREVERCLDAGMSGVGELNADGQGFRLDCPGLRSIARVCAERGAPLLLHTNEPVGHAYPGKGTLALTDVCEFARANPDLSLVLAHWGGGLPFYELMPEVCQALANTTYDTAASPLLYSPRVFGSVLATVGPRKVLFGSDYPLRLFPGSGAAPGFRRFLAQVNGCGLDPGAISSLLRDNAQRVYGIGAQHQRRGGS